MSKQDEAAARREKALELHLAGATFETIAAQLAYSHRSSARGAVLAALEARREAPASKDAAHLELVRLDAMLTGLWAKARRGDVAAVDRVLKIGERRTLLVTLLEQATPPATADAVESAQEIVQRKLRAVQ